jgi:hypothetical protein
MIESEQVEMSSGDFKREVRLAEKTGRVSKCRRDEIKMCGSLLFCIYMSVAVTPNASIYCQAS